MTRWKFHLWISEISEIFQAACVVLTVKAYLFDLSFAKGPSMKPTIGESGDLLLLGKYNASSNVHRGDVVVYRSPLIPDKSVCKRVIGLPGDRIPLERIIKDSDRISISDSDNSDYNRFYLHNSYNLYHGRDAIPSGHVWVEGDNPMDSMDSRYYGPIPIGLIYAKVICKILPLSEFGKHL